MGKYKQWLHHQEVGRRLRDQIASLEQERERVQKMAPAHPTTLPDADNAIVAALQAYLRQGGTVNRGADPRAAYGVSRVVDTDPEPRRPASGDSVLASPAGGAANAAARGGAAAPGVPARAGQTAAAGADTSGAGTAPLPSVSPDTAAPSADSVVGWWQRFRTGNEDA
jgi:hypothetical protein